MFTFSQTRIIIVHEIQKLMADFVDYTIMLGTFEGEDFIWKTVKKFNSFDEAYKYYHDYAQKQMTYTDEELQKVWSSGRIDIELRQGKKLLNWVGIFSRKVADPDFDPKSEEEPEVEDSHFIDR